MSGNIIQLNQDLIHTELKDLVKNSVGETLNAILDAEPAYWTIVKKVDTIYDNINLKPGFQPGFRL